METRFTGGANIAIKVPRRKYEETIHFYKNILKLEVEEMPITHPTVSRTHKVVFGGNTVWLDCVDNYAKPDIWLELNTRDVPEAIAHLNANGVSTCDELEQIPKDSHWITDPAGTVFIINKA
jgi:predicted enzyme related to lactoylglutathione lyase